VRAWRLFAASRPLQIAFLFVFLAAWAVHAVATYLDPELGGLFRWIGIDFGFYLAQANVLAHGDHSGIYSLEAAAPYRDALALYSNPPGVPLPPGPVPYPAIFAWLISPLTLVSPPIAFAVWTVINAAAALVLAWRVGSMFSPDRRLLAASMLLVSTALMFSLWFGQVQIFLAVAIGEAFIALRRSRDFSAGLWLAVLVLKPQYLLLMVPILIWKRRWRAVAGFAVGGAAIALASVAVAGPVALTGYGTMLIEQATSSSGALFTAVAPELMVNWRALVLSAPLDLGEQARLAITVLLSGVTIAAVVAALRGPWEPARPRFAGQMTLLIVGSILVAYHSHIHGVSMVAVPLAAFLAAEPGRRTLDRAIGRAIKLVVGLAIVAPWLWFAVLGRSHQNANAIVAVALAIGFALLFGLLRRTEAAAAELAPVSAAAAA
jgi:hypothetical protein